MTMIKTKKAQKMCHQKNLKFEDDKRCLEQTKKNNK